jgi:hypothetical protein
MFELLTRAGVMALVTLLVGLLPLGAGILYALRPTEQRLAILRPLSLAAIFGALFGSLSGVMQTLRMIWDAETAIEFRRIAPGLAESLVPMIVAFGSLMVAWLCVTLGIRRQL